MREIDALTSSTLKHLREGWWDASFTDFLRDTLEPRPGNRILDVGCGAGTGAVRLGQLRISQLRLMGTDLIVDRVKEALANVRGHNVRAAFTASDARSLPFVNDAFDATYCVAVLQHLTELSTAVQELARVTRPDGRVLVVEPDNAARYWYSSIPIGIEVFQLATRLFTTLESRDGSDPAVGPRVSAFFTRHGIETTAVRLFPVAVTYLGPPAAAVWEARRRTARAAIGRVTDEAVRQLGAQYLTMLERYAEESAKEGRRFVEIQNTMLFATVGRKAHRP